METWPDQQGPIEILFLEQLENYDELIPFLDRLRLVMTGGQARKKFWHSDHLYSVHLGEGTAQKRLLILRMSRTQYAALLVLFESCNPGI